MNFTYPLAVISLQKIFILITFIKINLLDVGKSFSLVSGSEAFMLIFDSEFLPETYNFYGRVVGAVLAMLICVAW